jgi:hypothetical protein
MGIGLPHGKMFDGGRRGGPVSRIGPDSAAPGGRDAIRSTAPGSRAGHPGLIGRTATTPHAIIHRGRQPAAVW